jgi:uncharacterized membrane protein
MSTSKKKASKKPHYVPLKIEEEIFRVGGKLKKMISVRDDAGNLLHNVVSPLMVEFYPRDLMQVIVGASLLAIPLAYTEETWNLGATLPLENIFVLLGLSVGFISLFIYYNSYKGVMKGHYLEFFKRVLSTYVFSFLVVSVILYLIQQAPWQTDALLAFKRVVIVSFPASLSAAVADMIK